MKESFSRKGFFWLPSKPKERIPGILRYKAFERIELDLIGCLYSKSDSVGERYEIIDGDVEGTLVVLSDVFESKRTFAISSNKDFCTYTVNYLFMGFNVRKFADLKFHRISAEYDYLSQWINKRESFEINRDRIKKEISVNYMLPQPISVSINKKLNCKLNFSVHGPSISHLQLEANIKQKVYVSFESTRLALFKKLLEYIWHFQKFLLIATLQPSFTQNVIFHVKIKNSKTPHYFDLIYISGKKQIEDNKRITQYDFLFTYADVQNDYQNLIIKWFNNQEKIETALNPFIDTFYKNVFNADIFLNTIKSLEAYHREFLRHSRMAQIERYKELFERVRRALNPILKIRSKPKFCERIKKYRNDLTHSNFRIAKKLNYKELYKLTQQIKVILLCNLLYDLGLRINQIKKYIASANSFGFIKKGK